jgi:cell wall-associated NlpC family hydrolase
LDLVCTSRIGNERSTRLTLTTLLVLTLIASAAGSADQGKVVENGFLDLTLRGYPEPAPKPPPPARDTSRETARDRRPLASRGAAGKSDPGDAQYADAVGRLGVTVGPWTGIYRRRDPRSQLLAPLPNGSYLAVKGQQDNYYAILMIDGSIGWAPVTSVRLLEYDVVADTRQREPSRFNPGVGALASAVLREAYRYLGVRYSWGGNGFRGIDCSGLVKNVFATCGLSLPRTASQQARVGTPVAFNELRAGDRLYFSVKRKSIDHTGIYIGDGHFIHAAMSRGEVGVDHLSKPLYGRSLVQAMRFE